MRLVKLNSHIYKVFNNLCQHIKQLDALNCSAGTSLITVLRLVCLFIQQITSRLPLTMLVTRCSNKHPQEKMPPNSMRWIVWQVDQSEKCLAFKRWLGTVWVWKKPMRSCQISRGISACDTAISQCNYTHIPIPRWKWEDHCVVELYHTSAFEMQ